MAEVEEMMNLTGLDEESAINYLLRADYVLKRAYNLFLSDQEKDGLYQPEEIPSKTKKNPPSSSSNLKPKLSTSQAQVIDDDFEPYDPVLFETTAHNNSSKNTHTNEYADEIRAPIQAKREVLSMDPRGTSLYGDTRTKLHTPFLNSFRNFKKEALQLESGFTGNPQKGLDELFQPPVDLTFKGSFEEARLHAQTRKVHVLVNVQDDDDFASHQLNRDVWSAPDLKQFINYYFVFLQTYKHVDDGRRFCTYYNVKEFPYIGVVDSLTGEELKQWQFPITAQELEDELATILSTTSQGTASEPIKIDEESPVNILDSSEPEIEILTGKSSSTEEITRKSLKEIAKNSSKEITRNSSKEIAKNSSKEITRNSSKEETTAQTHSEDSKQPTQSEQSLKKKSKSTTPFFQETNILKPKHTESPQKQSPQQPLKKSKLEALPTVSERADGNVTLQIRLSNGNTLVGKFYETDTLEYVTQWVTQNRTDGDSSFCLMTPFPREFFRGPELKKSLIEANLSPKAVLILNPE